MTIKFKHPTIKYTSRDFNSIRNDLIQYAKRYYPDSYKDFNDASFGSMMVDSVAYIGDMLSFYLDYQANESFLTTANEYGNIVKHGKAMGYKLASTPSSYGTVTLFIKVPVATSGLGPDSTLVPILRKGTVFSSTGGTSFTLIDDVNFADPKNRVAVANVSSTTGAPTTYAIRAYGQVVSGRTNLKNIQVGDYEKFKRLDMGSGEITEVVSVIDSAGNTYYEVENLSQNVIYRPVVNTGVDSDTVPNLFRPFVVMRRFVVEKEAGRTFLQFGYGSEDNLSNQGFLNPDDIALQRHARDYITDFSFDPSKLLQSDKFGVSPSNTNLQVLYRINDSTTVNAAASSITRVSRSIFKFKNESSINNSSKPTVTNSLEVFNEEPVVGDVTHPSADEIKRRIYDVFTSQNRAVTEQDYKALIYMLPGKFGSLKRCRILQDPDAFKRNLNVYVVSEDQNGNLTKSNGTIKNNLKNWLNQYRMMNDTLDILDAKIINIGINFTIVAQEETEKFSILKAAEAVLRNEFISLGEIGEPIGVSNVYRLLNTVPGVSDTVDVTFVKKSGLRYSPIEFNIDNNMSFDGRYLLAPEDTIFEIKLLSQDIRGAVR
tara:strand:+ start:241 stop:2040 length:1800 start_codon:yes stop_codon:yes gene_type:complete